MNNQFSIAIHGGAGEITRKKIDEEQEHDYAVVLKESILAGAIELDKGGTAIDAIVKSVMVLEDSPLFNAGKGSVFDYKGEIRMDAAIMNGEDLNAGAAANTRRVKNPITLARSVMENSEHVLISGSASFEFAMDHGIEIESDEYFKDEVRFAQWLRAKKHDEVYLDYDEDDQVEKFGTVGAVALDKHGNMAAATSTGGMTNKKYGRIGDSPLIGIGTYANNNTCAISCTGQGEYFMRQVLAYQISSMMELGGLDLNEATHQAVHKKLASIKGKGGLIAVDRNGNIRMPFNTGGMFRASMKEGEQELIKMFAD